MVRDRYPKIFRFLNLSLGVIVSLGYRGGVYLIPPIPPRRGFIPTPSVSLNSFAELSPLTLFESPLKTALGDHEFKDIRPGGLVLLL